jgi:hypothetical protein
MKRKLLIGVMLLSLFSLSACSFGITTDSGHDMDHAHMDDSEMPMMVHVSWKISTETVQPNKTSKLSIQIRDHEHPYISDFDTVHEKKMHLIVVSSDLSYFSHLHPTYEGKGLFTVALNVPAAGDYTLFADFKPTGAAQHVERTVLNVTGTAKSAQPLVVDKVLDKVVDGKKVTFSSDALTAGKEAMLMFNLKDAKTGKAITDLQPYLGAIGHVVIISEDTQTYLHVHPMDDSSTGPDAMFMTTFPKAGVYKIFGQFQQNGKVFVVPFIVKVN